MLGNLFKYGLKRAPAVNTLGALVASTSRMAFSDVSTIERGIMKLNKALEKESQYEKENYAQVEDS